ncbi:MAG: anti-sigma factor family protein [Leptospirillia bacterium]
MNADCQNIRDRFGDYLECSLPILARERVAGHLAGCSDCAHALEMTRIMLDTLHEEAEPQLPNGFSQRLSARLHQAADQVRSAQAEVRPAPVKGWFDRLFSASVLRPMGGVAAAVLVLVGAFLFTERSLLGNVPSVSAPAATLVAMGSGATAVPVAYGSDAVVRIRFDAAQAVEGVRFSLELPPGVRMVADGRVVDSSMLRWQGNLAQGINVIPLHVRGVAQGEWTVTATIEKAGARKERSVGLLVSGV